MFPKLQLGLEARKEEAWVSESGLFKLLLLELKKSAEITKRFLQSPTLTELPLNALYGS